MDNKERYKEFCLKEKKIPIYSQPWWMDAVVGENNWGVYLVGEDSNIKASFVYYILEEDGKTYIERALLTQNNGVYIKYPEGQGIIAQQRYEEKILDEVLDYIESLNLAGYRQQYNWRLKNCLPFFWRYYMCTIKYTYIIHDTENIEAVRKNYSSKTRNIIRKAQRSVNVTEINDIEMFYRVNKMTFDRQNIDIPYSYDAFKRIYNECLNHNATKLLCASDFDGNIHSVAMIVYDDHYVYFLLNGTNPEYRESQGNYLLIDACIEEAHKMGKAFDFEGSVIKGVNHAYREFGGDLVPYFQIKKEYDR